MSRPRTRIKRTIKYATVCRSAAPGPRRTVSYQAPKQEQGVPTDDVWARIQRDVAALNNDIHNND